MLQNIFFVRFSNAKEQWNNFSVFKPHLSRNLTNLLGNPKKSFVVQPQVCIIISKLFNDKIKLSFDISDHELIAKCDGRMLKHSETNHD